MRIRVELPQVKPNEYDMPEVCPYEGCGGVYFKRHGVQGEPKPIRDLTYERVMSYRWKCLRCGKTFRVYPRGVSEAQQSDRMKATTVLLYVLGLSYGGVTDVIWALGSSVGKTTVYNNVQEAGQAARGRRRRAVRGGKKRTVIGADATYVKVKGEQVGVEVVVDDESGELLGLDIIVNENEEEVREVIEDVVEDVDAEVVISDDHGAYKETTDALGLQHQICRKHVKDNVEEVADSIREQTKRKDPKPEGLESSMERLEEDLAQLERLVAERPAEGAQQLEAFYHRYKAVPLPRPGKRHTVWVRTRLLITRLWERWGRLTLDQRREDLEMDGTNNSCERLIGWWIKERTRTMRGYKRQESIRNVVTLTARMGVQSGRYDMTELYA